MPVDVRMPQISMTMIDGRIVKWHKKAGDSVTEGELLLDIETDKIVDVLTASSSGILLNQIAEEGDIVPVGDLLCIIGQRGETLSGETEAAKKVDILSERSFSSDTKKSWSGLRASPLAKKIAAHKGIDLKNIIGTGPGGMIVKAHLAVFSPSHVQQTLPQPGLVAQEEDTVIPFEGIRRVIADNLMLSKRSAADVTTVADVNMGAVRDVRKVLPISYTAFAISASAKALTEYPVMNALIEEERIILKKQVNISVAVATDKGLLTPVIHDAGHKNLMSVAEDLADLSVRGRDGKLTARDFEDGTFTITNSGVYGSIIFTPIINHPQSAVLGLGRIAPTPVVIENQVVPALMMYMSLTYNHRSIDGEMAVKFLQRVKFYLENPKEMLTGLVRGVS